jgi:hypothetical protein
MLYNLDPVQFPMGTVGTSVHALTEVLFSTPKPRASSQLVCLSCNYQESKCNHNLGHVLYLDASPTMSSVSSWIRNLQRSTRMRCPLCDNRITQSFVYHDLPEILFIEYPRFDLKIDKKIRYNLHDESRDLYLRGIVYSGQFHFVSRYISDNKIWYHDGITTRDNCIEDGFLDVCTLKDLQIRQNKKIVLAVYAQE